MLLFLIVIEIFGCLSWTGCRLRKNTYSPDDNFICTDMTISDLKDIPITSNHLRLSKIEFPIKAGRRTMAYQWFQMIGNVKTFILSETELKIIDNDAFNATQFAALKHLVLEDVPIETIKANAFRGLRELVDLHLGGTKVTGFEKTTLATLPQLTTFTMLNCGPNKITLDLFQTEGLLLLTTIDIEKCNLQNTITHETFSRLRLVKELKLPSNQITEIGDKSFSSLYSELKLLDLSGNKLTRIPTDIFKMKSMSIILKLNENSWICDCAMEDLRTFLQRSETPAFQIKCEKPFKHLNKDLSTLPYLCNETQSLSNREMNGFETTVEVMCEFLSSPNTLFAIGYTVPVPRNLPLIDFENGKIFIDKKNFFKTLDLVGIVESYTKQNKIVLTCMDVWTKEKHVHIESQLNANQIYRFCTKPKGAENIMPSDCVVLISTQDEVVPNDEHEISDPLTSLFCHFVFVMYGMTIGVGVSLGIVKYFPNWIFRQPPVIGPVFVMFPKKYHSSRPIRR